jgi:beta-galactosidase
VQAQVAVVFNPLVPLLGGEQAYGDRRSLHRAVAGYHRMFFERNIPVEFPSARELSVEGLRRFKLVIVPYPILLTPQMAATLEQYVREGGRLFVEARPGWQDDRGHAEPILPGFGWHRMFGVRETEVRPVKDVEVRWGERSFLGTSFAERLEAIDPTVRVVATFGTGPDAPAAAFERAHGRGHALLLGTFAGERNQQEPVPMHPLADALIEWAGIDRSPLRSSSFVEARRMTSPRGELLVLLNHGQQTAEAEYVLQLSAPASSIREIVAGQTLRPADLALTIKVRIPAESARVYRIDYREPS